MTDFLIQILKMWNRNQLWTAETKRQKKIKIPLSWLSNQRSILEIFRYFNFFIKIPRLRNKRLTDMNQFDTFQTIQQPIFIFIICYLKILILKNILKFWAQNETNWKPGNFPQMGSCAWICLSVAFFVWTWNCWQQFGCLEELQDFTSDFSNVNWI